MSSYITLASDSSQDTFPGNRIGSFRSKLPTTLELDRDRYQVGLSYISWPNKLHNLEDGHILIRCQLPPAVTDTRGAGNTPVASVTIVRDRVTKDTAAKRLPPGYYGSVKELVSELNELIKKVTFKDPAMRGVDMRQGFARFELDPRTEMVKFVLSGGAPCQVTVRLSRELYIKLGFGTGASGPRWIKPLPLGANDISGVQINAGIHTADLTAGKNAVFVYSDVIRAERIVGNKVAGLLAIVPFAGAHNEIVHYTPQRVEYYNLQFNSFQEIQIDLVDDLGHILKFQSGKVFITLHIKDKFA